MKEQTIERKGKMKFIILCIVVCLLSILGGSASKFLIKSSSGKEFNMKWSDEIGTLKTDLAYGKKESNMFDLYLPKDNTKQNYGLAVYIHAGGFTSGDKADDQGILAWLCSKGYVAAGINYTLRTDENNASVLQESNEIKAAIPEVVKAAGEAGYTIDKMTIAGGSAGHALAMIYAYRDSKQAPVPVVLTFGAVGPSSFNVEDWGIFGLGMDTDESKTAGAYLFTVMSGEEITVEEITDGSYLTKVHVISAADYVKENPIPSVVAYGACDKVQPFEASKRLEKALQENNVDYKYYVLKHSGHGLQNDDKVAEQWMKSVEEYLVKYMPVD